MQEIKVGDFVEWRPNFPNALGFTGCKVLELGTSMDGRPYARLDLGRFGEARAAVDQLRKE